MITAQNLPFNQGSDTLNKVRFTLRDLVGNTGSSPVYSVRTLMPPIPPSPDFDHDGDVDQEDFAYLQVCLSGLAELSALPIAVHISEQAGIQLTRFSACR